MSPLSSLETVDVDPPTWTDAPPESATARGLGLVGVPVFASAFLGFQVQPMVAKFILPWFGSTPGVWTTSLLFFQVLLVGGYAYGHVLASRLSRRHQATVHCFLLAVALVTLPITPDETWRPGADDAAVPRILALLSVSVGLPYLLLTGTGPLMLAWAARLEPGRSPYRLYALSNAGSLIALVSYPWVVEPFLCLREQTGLWSVVFGFFTLWVGACSWRFGRDRQPATRIGRARGRPLSQHVSARAALQWIGLSGCASGLLLATTNQMCLDVAVVPFLWIVPLALYLLTFILCFESARWYRRRVFFVLLPFTLVHVARVLQLGVDCSIVEQIVGYSSALFVTGMCCHGELARRRPAPAELTLFFLLVAVGGALGGIFVAIVAPALFSGYHEYPLLLALGAALAAYSAYTESGRPIRWILQCGGAVGVLGLGVAAGAGLAGARPVERGPVEARNFYGTLAFEQDAAGERWAQSTLRHGRITHGFQYRHLPRWPTSYFGPRSGIGLALRLHPARDVPGRAMRVGVIGLGAGTLAAYAQARIDPEVKLDGYAQPGHREPPDSYHFYEINPLVVDWAENRFSFLADARGRGAGVDVYLGDARLVLENQFAQGQGQQFDVLAVDAFSGDAIPIHLLTREGLAIYREHLREDGILAIHVTNRFVDLKPVVAALAREAGQEVVHVSSAADDEHGTYDCDWLLVTTNREFLDHADVRGAARNLPLGGPLWTDDFSSLFELIQ